MSPDALTDGLELTSVQWRSQPIQVKVFSNLALQKTSSKPSYPLALYALLKSNVQKQIRRQLPEAITTAQLLLHLCEFEFLRRLVIIAAEDVEVSMATTVIAWLMVVTGKGFQLEQDHKNWILGYVATLIKHPVCRRLEINNDLYKTVLDPWEVMNSDYEQKNQLVGILCRSAYGGLKCDPPMLNCCLDWQYQTGTPLLEGGVDRWDGPFPALVFHKSAVDFHIWGALLDKLHVRYPEYSCEYLKAVIWNCSSSYNKRKKRKIKTKYNTCWSKVKEDFMTLTQAYLTGILSRYKHFTNASFILN
jgi:hypothetical protein